MDVRPEEPALATAAAAEPAVAAPSAARARTLRLERYGTIAFFVIFFAVIGALKGGQFLSFANLAVVLGQNSHVAFAACAVTVTLIAGQFDLSVGSLVGMSAVLAAVFPTRLGIPLVPSLLLVLAVGVAAGAINGLLVVKAHVNAFIATLGTGSAFAGVALWASGGSIVYEGIPQGLTKAGTVEVASVSLPVFYVLALMAVGWIVTTQTVTGRYWYATGASPTAARLANVPVTKLTVRAFVVGGALAAAGGLILLAKFGSADPNTGPDLLLPAFAAAFLGSSILSDGRFAIVGTIIAAFLIAYAQNGLEVLGLSAAVKPVFNGAVLVGALALSEALRRQRR